MSAFANSSPLSREPHCSTEASATQLLKDISLHICHELRTPLTSIQGFLGLLHNGHLGSLSEEGQQLLNIAINNANRLTRLANAIDHEWTLPMTLLSPDDLEQLQLENDLYEAFDRQEFQLVYQPIISVEFNRVIAFEALARWQHPSKGLISPTIFIPLAEKIGLIHRLGLWILEQACHQLQVWQQHFPLNPPLAMSVNLSAVQLLQPDLVLQVQQVLQQTAIAPNSLKIEITESTLIENHDVAIAILSALKALGIQFYIDDFGTGYSSLGRLQDLPIDALKIDRSFIHSKNWDINAAIILLAAKLGLDVIAEGIEISDDFASLKTLGCKKMQGYFFSQPVESEAAGRLILKSFSVV